MVSERVKGLNRTDRTVASRPARFRRFSISSFRTTGGMTRKPTINQAIQRPTQGRAPAPQSPVSQPVERPARQAADSCGPLVLGRFHVFEPPWRVRRLRFRAEPTHVAGRSPPGPDLLLNTSGGGARWLPMGAQVARPQGWSGDGVEKREFTKSRPSPIHEFNAVPGALGQDVGGCGTGPGQGGTGVNVAETGSDMARSDRRKGPSNRMASKWSSPAIRILCERVPLQVRKGSP